MSLLTGQSTLDEVESKALLAQFGVPVVDESVAVTPALAAESATHLGYPVALKGLAADLAHKTERGLVRVGLTSAVDVEGAATEMARAHGTLLDGFVVQPHVSGHRELVAGLVRDPHYGPVVMFGLGGVLAEAIDDVSFALAPLSVADAEELIERVRAAALLGPFRGEAPVSRTAVVGTLMALSRLAEERPDVVEVDINPLKVRGDGTIVAVDALVRLRAAVEERAARPVVNPRLVGALFYPKSVAVVGASASVGKWGHLVLTNLLRGGFPGEIFLVNPRGGTICEREVYRSIAELPAPVDMAVVTVPAAEVLALLPELRAKGAKGLVVVSSGFAETGEEGRRLEQELVSRARELELVLIGPNTMGICNPHSDLYCTGAHVRPELGGAALVAQSGNLGNQLLVFAVQQGIGIRAFCGSGNEAMVSVEDVMDAFEVDDRTETVVLYLESLKDPRRFFTSARRVCRKKPVIVLKGGRTQAGERAAASHTGAMASNARIFSAACRQAGVVEVEQPMDLLDLTAALSSLPLPRGPRVGIVTMGGGWGVVAADLCQEHGLKIPPLDSITMEEIGKMLPAFWSHGNPVDLVGQFVPSIIDAATEALARWDGCDAVLNLGMVGQPLFMGSMLESVEEVDPAYTHEALSEVLRTYEEAERAYIQHVVRLMEKYDKPIVGVKLMEDESHQTLFEVDGGPYRGLFFQTPERAVKVLAGMHQVARWRSRRGGRV